MSHAKGISEVDVLDHMLYHEASTRSKPTVFHRFGRYFLTYLALSMLEVTLREPSGGHYVGLQVKSR